MSNDLEARIAEIPDGEEYVSVDSIRPAEGERSQDRTITTYCITKLLKKVMASYTGRSNLAKT